MGMLFTDVTSMQLILLPLDESYCVLNKKMQLIFEIRTLIESFESTTHVFLAENYREVQFLHSWLQAFNVQDLLHTVLYPA